MNETPKRYAVRTLQFFGVCRQCRVKKGAGYYLMFALKRLNYRVRLAERFQAYIETPKPDNVFQYFVDTFVERHFVILGMPQSQGSVAFSVDIINLDVGFVTAQIILLR